MAEPEVFRFSFGEIAELMARHLELKDGLWGLYVKFGIAAANAGAGPEDVRPTALVPILELGLQRMKEPSALTVDAAALRAKPSKVEKGSGARRRAGTAR